MVINSLQVLQPISRDFISREREFFVITSKLNIHKQKIGKVISLTVVKIFNKNDVYFDIRSPFEVLIPLGYEDDFFFYVSLDD